MSQDAYSSQQQQLPTHNKMSKVKLAKRAFFLTLGAAFMSVGLEIFLVPNNIIDGGIV
jgi:uncharacterized membrane-anchored protein YitT (DUF2179 family)